MKQYIQIFKLSALLILVPVLIWPLSISKTAKAWKEYRILENEEPVIPKQMNGIHIQADKPLLSTGAIMEALMPACESGNVSVDGYSPELDETAPGMELYRARLFLSGKFIPLLSVMEMITEKVPQVKISSAEFRCDEKMRRENYVRLEMILVQLETKTETYMEQ